MNNKSVIKKRSTNFNSFILDNDHVGSYIYDLSLIAETLLILQIQTKIPPKQLISKSRNPPSSFKDLVSCYVHIKGLNNRNRAKLVPVANVSGSTVTCGNVSLSSNIYEVGVIYGNNIKSLKTCLKRYLDTCDIEMNSNV